MTYQEKKDLYESLMDSIAPAIEKAISEYYYEDTVMFAKNFMSINNQLIKIKERLDQKIENLSQEEIDDMCLNCLSHAHAIHSISSQRILDETFKNTEEFKESFENLKKRLGTAFGLVDWQVDINNVFHNGNALARTYYKIDNNVTRLQIYSIIVPAINLNIPTLIDFMEDNGYYFIRCFIGEDSLELERSDSKTVRMAEIFFAQKQPANILKWAQQYKYFYHVTPSRNMPFIRKYGLVPQKRESEFNITNEEIHYPERTYFFCSDDDETAIEYAMMDMMSGNYHLLKIDIKKIPETIPVYSDPLLGGNAVYIEQTIEPDLIEDLGNFEINERTRLKYLKR